jgi:TolB protein
MYILTLSSGARRLLPIERHNEASVPSSPAWSPDGTQIAFVMSAGDGLGLQIFRIPATCDETDCPVTQVTNTPGQSYDPVWTPNGEGMAFTSYRPGQNRWDGTWSIYTVNADGSDMVQVTNTPGANDFNPTYSPDGNYLAFDRVTTSTRRPQDTNIYIMRTNGSEITCISSDAGEDPSWTALPVSQK